LNLIKKKRKFSARKLHTSAWENLDGVETPESNLSKKKPV